MVPTASRVACNVVRTELLRAVRRSAPDRIVQARTVLDSSTLTDFSAALFEQAGRLDPTTLRSRDPIISPRPLDLGDDLDGLVTYDDRLAEAARGNGIAVIAPA